jgi:hypothetical protein
MTTTAMDYLSDSAIRARRMALKIEHARKDADYTAEERHAMRLRIHEYADELNRRRK